MKINQLKLKNIGSFSGEHCFSFQTNDLQKNIVLIGGRNGAGKTTIFESMRLCLYGYKLYGYRQNSQTYTNKVRRLINDGAKAAQTAIAAISMQILIEDGYANNVFELSRQWALSGKVLKEDLTVKKDGSILNSEELQDFDSYLMQTIPPALFNFHFFDGENISDFIFDRTNGQAFRKAFLQICGLDTFDLIEEQLHSSVHIQKGSSENDLHLKYDAAKQDLRAATITQAEAFDCVANTQRQIDSLDDQIAVLDKKMQHYGGVEGSKWTAYQKKLNTEEGRRDELRHALKEAANDTIPFVILKKELAALKAQLDTEEKLRRNRLFKERLLDRHVKQRLKKELRPFLLDVQLALSEDLTDALYQVMKEEVTEGGAEFLSVSENEYLDLISKINRYTSYDTKSLINAEQAVDDSLEYVKSLRAEMESKEVIDSQHYLIQKNDFLMQIVAKKTQLSDEKVSLVQAMDALNAKQKIFDKAYESYRAVLKEQSVTDMSARALLAFGELKQKLYAKYVKLVEESFSVHFHRLISKTDLIDGIYISASFEVVAYKQSKIEISNILKQIEAYGEEYVYDDIGERALVAVKESNFNNGALSVPLKVEQHFSAGEQQIFVMALYQALAEIRTAELPFVIDTPLARIDRQHRENILVNFFAKLPGQVIILSTDEEINHDGISAIGEKISDAYLIEHGESGTSMAKENSYFQGVFA